MISWWWVRWKTQFLSIAWMCLCICLSLSLTCIFLSFSVLQFLFSHYASGFSSKTIPTFSASKLFLLYSSVTAGTIPVFPDTLLWSFIEGCFKHQSCSFVAHLQKMTSSGEQHGWIPCFDLSLLHLPTGGRCAWPLEPKQVRLAKFYYLTHKFYDSHSCQWCAHLKRC